MKANINTKNTSVNNQVVQEQNQLVESLLNNDVTNKTDNTETLLEPDDRVAANLIEDIAAPKNDSLTEQQKLIDEHNRRVVQTPEFKAQVMYENYINTCGMILDGPAKRRLKKQLLREAKKGKFDYMFDPEKIAKREAREQAKFDELNKPVIHKVDDISPEVQATLKEMANMEVIKSA